MKRKLSRPVVVILAVGLVIALWLGWSLARRASHPETSFSANTHALAEEGQTVLEPLAPESAGPATPTNTQPVVAIQQRNTNEFVAISGTVLDANGSPLFGVAVSINDYLSRERYEACG